MNANPALVAAALLFVFIMLEGRSRVGDAARSLAAGGDDAGSTRRIGVAFLVSLNAFVVSSLLAVTGIGAYDEGIARAGLAVMIAGMALRFWSARVLGASYTRTLRVAAAQRLVRAGPYRVVRHPGYTGSILMWTGAAIASGDVLGVVVIVIVTVRAYVLRVRAEDRMLATRFGSEYDEYARRVRRLVPFVF
jgi:protein-S-isoprenylcysteine O-methyltransferase Ste14